MTDADQTLASTLTAYVPRILLERLATENPPAPGQTEHLDGVALFVNLSGFTQISERLAYHGRQGAEALTEQLNATYGKLIGYVHAYGGSVVDLGSTSLTAAFVNNRDAPKLAVSCALMMQAEMGKLGPQEALGEAFDISIKIGMGKGPMTLLHIGQETRRGGDQDHAWLKALFTGEAVERTMACEQRAARGDIVADPVMAAALADVLTGQHLDAGFVLVEDVLPLGPPEPLPTPFVDPEALRPYLPSPFQRGLDLAASLPTMELRDAVSMFVHFHGLDYDAPDAAQGLKTYIAVASDVIEQHNGTLFKISTWNKESQLHVVFSAPEARETIERRAVKCALALLAPEIAAVTEHQIGIASGRVFAGLLGNETRREYTIIGEIVGLSARLATLAGPEQILLDAATHRRVFEVFDTSAHPNVRIKGNAHLQTVYSVKGIREHRSDLEAGFLLSRRRLIGRDAEMAEIERVVSTALRGEGQTLVITGPPGIGKSRLVEEVIRLWVPDGQVYGEICPPHATGMAYLPWVPIWRRMIGEAGDEQTLRKRLANLCPEYPEAARFMAPVLGLPVDVPPSLAEMDAASWRQRLFEITLAMLRVIASQEPLLVVLSDLQWSDRATNRLIEYVSQRSAGVPLLMCLEFRPYVGLLPVPEDEEAVTWLDLAPMSGEDGWRLIDGMAHNTSSWPESLLNPLEDRLGISRDSVNPLLVEEKLNRLIQVEALVPDDGTYRPEDTGDPEFPDDIVDVLLARMQALDESSANVLRVASVLDSPFTPRLLFDILADSMSENEARSSLTTLEQLGHLVMTQQQPGQTIRFRHGLMREVVYDSLPHDQRHEWHARVADILERMDVHKTDSVVLARHFDLGQQSEKAGRYSARAGELAQNSFDYPTALEHYQTALRHLATLPDDQSWDVLTQLRLQRGRIFLEQGRFAELESDYREARRLALNHDDLRSVVRAGLLAAERCRWEGDYEQMARVAGATVQLAAEEQLAREMTESLHLQGLALEALGRTDEALGALTTARDLARDLGQLRLMRSATNALASTFAKSHQFDFALPIWVEAESLAREAQDLLDIGHALSNKGSVLIELGQHREAQEALAEALDIHEQTGQPLLKAYVLKDLGALHCWTGEYEAGHRAMGEAARIFKQLGDDDGDARLALTMGEAYHLDLGDLGSARLYLARGLEQVRAAGDQEALVRGLLALARVNTREGQYGEARALLDEAVSVINHNDLDWYRPVLDCNRARLALAQGDFSAARKAAQDAVEEVEAGNNPLIATVVYRLLAQSREGDPPDEVEPLYRTAIARGRQVGKRLDLTRALEAAGTWQAAQPKKKQQRRGRKLLDEAADLYHTMGQQSEVERLNTLEIKGY